MKKLVNIIIKIDKWFTKELHQMYPELNKHMKKK